MVGSRVSGGLGLLRGRGRYVGGPGVVGSGVVGSGVDSLEVVGI